MEERYASIDAEIIKHGSLRIIVDLFFEYEWSNFLHAIVEQICRTILGGQNEDLKHEVEVRKGAINIYSIY